MTDSRLSRGEREELLDNFIARWEWTRAYFAWRPKRLPGVASASVNLATETASLRAGLELHAGTITGAVEQTSYNVPLQTVQLALSGMNLYSAVTNPQGSDSGSAKEAEYG